MDKHTIQHHKYHKPRTWAVAAILVGVAAAGCAKDEAPGSYRASRRARVDEQVRLKFARGLDELPTLKLIAISPHNQNIEKEFEEAFSLHHALAHGQRVEIEWNDVGGGSSRILEYLRNVYGQADTTGIDVVWGGGEDNFQKMAAEGILQPMRISADAKANIPATFGGLAMYDADGYWCGSAVSGFGFLYNAATLKMLGLPGPKLWDDLGEARYFDLLALADPTQSGSAATAYEMIVQSGSDWPAGWAKLLAILSNAKRFYDGASSAADAVISEAPIATCIDFYGAMRVAKYPEDLVYVSPAGQTAFSPDPIGILVNPPHAELAQRFVDFVLSARGQALWALKIGADDGPVQHNLMRQPIRRDVYETYAADLSPWIVNPYQGGNEMTLDVSIRQVRFGVLRQLVRAAAIDNARAMAKAKARLIETDFDPARLMLFNALPENVATIERLAQTAQALTDPTQAERIVTDWQRFFGDKYENVAR